MGENISDENLFHFTKSFENLVSILKNGLIPNYCLENWLTLDNYLEHIGIPMVCFSDIPRKFIEPHKNKYGPYGISISKDRGIKNGITPVAYIHKNSLNYKALITLSQLYNQNVDAIRSKDFIRRENDLMHGLVKIYKHDGIEFTLINAYYNLLFLSKPYSGDDFIEKNVCFYNEREWRYFPVQ